MISAVIITLNESDHIEECIRSISSVVDEIILIDANSEDDTIEKAAKFHKVSCYKKEWEGYGHARNFGASKAMNDWILSIDADERLDEVLTRSIERISLNETHVYKLRRVNHLGNVPIRFGYFKPEVKTRIYNRKISKWNLHMIHEELIHSKNVLDKLIAGRIVHLSFRDEHHMNQKLRKYAKLKAAQWIAEGNTVTKGGSLINPFWHFIRSYLVFLGFIEGSRGLAVSKAAYNYSRWKYFYIRAKLNRYK